MKKKGKQAARLPKRVRRPRKKPNGKIGVSAEPVSPSSAWLEMLKQSPANPVTPVRGSSSPIDAVAVGGTRSVSRHAGPGLDLLNVPPPDSIENARENWPHKQSGFVTAPAPDTAGMVDGVLAAVVNGVCTGCLEKIATTKDHPWWCPWWDTPEGRKVSPF